MNREKCARYSRGRGTKGVVTTREPCSTSPIRKSERETVGDVLADPERYLNEALADPIEGVGYGRQTAKVLRRPTGEIFIHSFAHGGAFYHLVHDAGSIEGAIMASAPNDAARLLCDLAVIADLDPIEEKTLVKLVAKRTRVGERAVAATLKQARMEKRAKQGEAELQALIKEDGRCWFVAPEVDSERLPTTLDIDGALVAQGTAMRDLEGRPTEARRRSSNALHELMDDVEEMVKTTRLPAPEMLLLSPHDEFSMAHVIERAICFYTKTKKSDVRKVAVHPNFVKHYMKFRTQNSPSSVPSSRRL